MKTPIKTLITSILLCMQLTHLPAQAINGISPVTEPYSYVSTGSFSGDPAPHSPDPLVSYRWTNPKASDELEIFLQKPVVVSSDKETSFENLESLTTNSPYVTVKGTGSIRLDFGEVNAAWLEFDSPDLSGKVEMSISEYNEPARAGVVPNSLTKTLAPGKYGNTYRLELNEELYEGVRFGWIHVKSFSANWHITDVRLVCQTKPANYNGSFSCSDTLLTRIWYTGAYTVKLNLLKDYFGAILMYRGDRFSWTGDAHPAQAASMVAFGNYDFVRRNIMYTAPQSNSIRSYSLYWVLSMIDYYKYTNDTLLLKNYIPTICNKLDDAWSVYGTNPALVYYGWDERLGAGFEHPNYPEPQEAYKMLSIRAWKEFAEVADGFYGARGVSLKDKYNNYAAGKISEMRKDIAWCRNFGLHSGADAVTTGLLSDVEKKTIYEKNFTDKINRISYSPFNQYFVLQAMAKMNKYDDALSSVRDLWGGQIEYGGTTFFENYRPSWNKVIGKNNPVPNNQCGFTSLCHPWGAGVTKWLSEEVLGIKPTSPGFTTFDIVPHLGRTLTRVSGKTPTPLGDICASFDVGSGNCFVSSPGGTSGRIGIPKVEKNITGIKVNGSLVWDGVFHPTEDIGGATQDSMFIFLTGVQPGNYTIVITYQGTTPQYVEKEEYYPAACVGIDTITSGNWGKVYGKEGYVLCNYNGDGNDKRLLPSYVSSVNYYKIMGNGLPLNHVWASNTTETRALAPDTTNRVPRNATCLYAMDGDQIGYTFTSTINIVGTHPYKVSLYFLDWDKKGREIAVEMFDANTLELIAPVKILKNCAGGAYLTYSYDKSAKFRINLVRGDNAVLSGIFFDPGSPSTGLTNPGTEKNNPDNPFDRIYITSESAEFSFTTANASDLVEVTLFDSLGRKISTPLKGYFNGCQRITNPIPKLSSGIYLLQVKVNNKSVMSDKIFIRNV